MSSRRVSQSPAPTSPRARGRAGQGAFGDRPTGYAPGEHCARVARLAPDPYDTRAPSAPARASDRALCLIVSALTLCYCFTAPGRAVVAGAIEPHSSPIDWCEDNYEFISKDAPLPVAEFWNALSSLTMMPVALSAGYMVFSLGHARVRPQAAFLLFGLSAISLGSFYFHARLSALGQVMDEVSICWVNLYAMFYPMRRSAMAKLIGERAVSLAYSWEFLLAAVVTFPIAGIVQPATSHVLTLLTLPATIATTHAAFKTLPPHGVKEAAPTFYAALYSAVLGFGFWLLDRVGCQPVQQLLGFNPQFHAWWHLIIFSAGWHTCVFMFYVTAEAERAHGQQHRIRPYGLVTMTIPFRSNIWEMV